MRRSSYVVAVLVACASGAVACSSRSPDVGPSDGAADGAVEPDGSESSLDGGPDDAMDAQRDGCVPSVASSSRACGDFTVGKGPACDDCVAGHCLASRECCMRVSLCDDPQYEYRIMIAACIAQYCGDSCGVACESWPTQ